MWRICRSSAFALSVLIVSMAGTIFHFRSRRLTAERSQAAEQERRLFDRITDFLDGFKETQAQPAAQRRIVRRRRQRVADRGQYQDPRPVRDVQADRLDRRAICTSCSARSFSSLRNSARASGGALDRQDHRGAALCHRRVLRPGAVDSDPDECQCRRRPDRAAGRSVALDRVLRDRRDRVADELRDDRDARHRVQLRGPAFGRRVPYRADRLHPALRRTRLHHRRQRFGQIDVSAGAGRALSSRIRRNPAGRHARQQGDPRRVSRAVFGDFLRLSSVSAAVRRSRSRIRANSPACWPNSAWRTRPA